MEPARRFLRRPLKCSDLLNVMMDEERLGNVWPRQFRDGEKWCAQDRTTGIRSFHETRDEAAVAVCERSGWGPFAPADKGDFRIDVYEHEEPELGCTHTVTFIDDRGFATDSFTTDDPWGAVETARYCQATPLEQRWAEDWEAGR